MDNILVNEAEAAGLLGICERMLWDLRKEGEVPFVALRNRILYSPEELREWVRARSDVEVKDRSHLSWKNEMAAAMCSSH